MQSEETSGRPCKVDCRFYPAAKMIVDLIRRGKKIGVTSNSHKAIHNLLEKVESVAAEKA